MSRGLHRPYGPRKLSGSGRIDRLERIFASVRPGRRSMNNVGQPIGKLAAREWMEGCQTGRAIDPESRGRTFLAV